MKGLPGNRQPFFYAGKRLSHGFETTNVVSFFSVAKLALYWPAHSAG